MDELKTEVPAVTPMETKPAPVIPTVDPELFAQMMARMTALENRNTVLEQAVSKNDLLAAQAKNKPAATPSAYLKVLNGKIVVSWKSEKPEMFYNPSNPEVVVGEALKAKYFFIDGTDSGIINQTDFTRTGDKVLADVVEGWKAIKDVEVKEVTLHFRELITTDEDLKAKFVMPADYKINKNFLNA
jgi:hypothetical protein